MVYSDQVCLFVPEGLFCGIIVFVKMPLSIFRLLAVFALLGIILAPLSRPAMAAGMASAATQHEMMTDAAVDHAAMPADMSCCPDDVPPPDCGKHCLMMMCAAGALSMLSTPSFQFLPARASAMPVSHPDGVRSGISITPPPKPPKA